MSTSNTIVTALSKRTSLAEAIPLRVPLAVYVDITNQCNFSCRFCPTGNDLGPAVGRGKMSLELFEHILRGFQEFTRQAGQRLKKLNLFWMGEPLINKAFYAMARAAKDAEIADTVALTTNGSLLTTENAERVVLSGLDVVLISFYGKSDEEYRSVSETVGFRRIVDGGRNLLSARARHGLTRPYVAAKFFQEDPEVERLLVHELRCVDSVGVETPFNWNASFAERSGREVPVLEPGPLEVCPSPWFVMSIGWDGHVGVCCSDYGYNIQVGDLRVQAPRDVWYGEALRSFRAQIADRRYDEIPACRGCTYYKVTHDPESNIDGVVRNDRVRALSVPELPVR